MHLVGSCLVVSILFLAPPSPAQGREASPALPELPVSFVPNRGQWPGAELYRADFARARAYVEDRGWTLCATAPAGGRGVAIRMRFATPRRPAIEPGQRLRFTSTWLSGSRSIAAVPAYRELTFRGMYDGVDVRLHCRGGDPEYDVVLAPHADLSRVQIVVEGAADLRLDDEGRLVMNTALGTVHQPPPDTFTVGPDGVRSRVPCRYVILAADRFGLLAPDWKRDRPLVVDPVVLYSSYFGGSKREEPLVVRADAGGRIYVAGRTDSTDMPATTGAYQTGHGGGTWDAFVFRVDPSKSQGASLEYATYFGGAGDDLVEDLAIQRTGAVALVGQTRSGNLPTQATSYQRTPGGGADAFVAVLDPTGAALVGSSYLGGAGDDAALGVDISITGDLAIVGWTGSGNFPVTANAFDRTHRGGTVRGDCFVTVLDGAATTARYSTFFGGSAEEGANDCSISVLGVITLSGSTTSTDLPTSPNAYDSTHNGGSHGGQGGDLFVAQLDPAQPPASQLRYATLIGGSGEEANVGCAVDLGGRITLAGTSSSKDFPTSAGAYQTTLAGGGGTAGGISGDAVVARLDPSRSGAQQLVFATYCGGSQQDRCFGMALDDDGVTTIGGWSGWYNNDYPTTPDAMQRRYRANDAFVTRLSADGTRILYSTLLGGGLAEAIWDLSRAGTDGWVDLCGITTSSNYPVQNPFQATNKGGVDGFVTRLGLIPRGTARFGVPTAGGGFRPTIHVLGEPVPNNAQFGLACSQAPPSTAGILAVSLGSIPAGVPVGFTLYVDPGQPHVLVPVTTDAAGESSLAQPYPGTPIPVPLYAQYVWGFTSPSASDAVKF